jgi:hypothetical protein
LSSLLVVKKYRRKEEGFLLYTGSFGLEFFIKDELASKLLLS